jgi:hypothetical protein
VRVLADVEVGVEGEGASAAREQNERPSHIATLSQDHRSKMLPRSSYWAVRSLGDLFDTSAY